MCILEAWVILSLLHGAALALAIEVVLLVQHQLARRYVLDTLVNVADCQLVTLCYRSAWHYELFPPAKDRNTVRPAAVIYQVGGPVEARARPQELRI